MKQQGYSRGSVLVAVLVMIALAVIMLTRLAESGAPDLLLAMRRADRDRLRADAQAALETTLAVLMDFREVDGALYAPAQGWSDPLTQAGYTPREGVRIEIGFEDESGKASLPVVTLEVLGKLLVHAGLEPSEATRAADALYAWMHRAHVAGEAGARAADYAWLAQPLAPPFRAPRSFEELAQVAGAGKFFYDPVAGPTPVLEKFKELVSLYRFEATNLNAAPPGVLLALGWDEAQVADVVKQRSGTAHAKRDYYRAEDMAGQSRQGVGAQVQVLRIHVDARQGAAQLRVSALVTWDGRAQLPPPIQRESEVTSPEIRKQRVAAAMARGNPTATKPRDLRYPFTILDYSETALPMPSPHEPAA